MKSRLVILFLMFAAFAVHAQRIVNACGDVDYVVPETQTLSEAKQTAITQARLKAIADEFGTIVSQTNTAASHT